MQPSSPLLIVTLALGGCLGAQGGSRAGDTPRNAPNPTPAGMQHAARHTSGEATDAAAAAGRGPGRDTSVHPLAPAPGADVTSTPLVAGSAEVPRPRAMPLSGDEAGGPVPHSTPAEELRSTRGARPDGSQPPAGTNAGLPAPPVELSDARLPNGFANPMPGGVVGGYAADTGLDIAGSPRPVYALAAGTLDYSEPGHTLWTGPGDNDNALRIELDEPLPYRGRRITHVWYAHLSVLAYQQREGVDARRHVSAGEKLGVSGRANGSPHLHLGLLLDGETSQRWGSYLLEDEVRHVLGDLRHGMRLPEH